MCILREMTNMFSYSDLADHVDHADHLDHSVNLQHFWSSLCMDMSGATSTWTATNPTVDGLQVTIFENLDQMIFC